MSAQLNPFHLAIPVLDIAAARRFYGDLLGFEEGRSDEHWVDWNCMGHQLVTHRVEAMPSAPSHNPVDGDAVPVPHFGVVLSIDAWRQLAERLERAGVDFIIPPRIRFAGEPGEQGTLFFRDPFGNALEFKGFRDMAALFAR
jgi:hypothetical protein